MSIQEQERTWDEPCGMPEGMCSCCDDIGCCHNPWWDDHQPYWIHNNDEGGDK